jgi:hypothetical protein
LQVNPVQHSAVSLHFCPLSVQHVPADRQVPPQHSLPAAQAWPPFVQQVLVYVSQLPLQHDPYSGQAWPVAVQHCPSTQLPETHSLGLEQVPWSLRHIPLEQVLPEQHPPPLGQASPTSVQHTLLNPSQWPLQHV